MKSLLFSVSILLNGALLFGGEGKEVSSIMNLLNDKVSTNVSQYNFVDELGSHQLLYADEMVFKNIPAEWEDEVSNLFLVKVSPSKDNLNTPIINSTYKSVEQILMVDVIKAQWENGSWVKNNIESGFLVGHPYMTTDGKKLFFISDMKGTLGGTDLYLSEKNSKGLWSEPVSLKYFTNTTENEYFPSISDNSLRYISKGKVTFVELSEFMQHVSTNETSISPVTTTVSKTIAVEKPNVTISNNITYKIQLGLFKSPNWTILNKEFSKYGTLESVVEEGVVNVKVGDFDNLDSVDSILESIKRVNGFSSAFIVSFNKGRVISTDEARAIYQKSKFSSK